MVALLLIGFLIGVAATLLAVAYFRRFPHTSRGSEQRYLKELRSLLEEMPFIFRDVSLTVLQDYVQVEHENLNLVNLEPRPTRAQDSSLEAALRRNKRVLILGAAGVGKTTFQRFSVLRIINNSSTVAFLNPGERVIPIFVPLKAVDNSQPAPILRYITAMPFFSGKDGGHRLLERALAERLLICLDGYDEISFLGGTRNFVREEINAILRPVSGAGDRLSEKQRALAHARIWISSRREFFLLNPIDALARTVSPSLAVQFRGIGNNRARLVNNIFTKYAASQSGAEIDLDAEYFLGQIGASGDEELIELSHNPLFLTVMCYIYAQRVKDTGAHDVPWLSSTNELITTCVSLLIRDLDEAKARDLPPARREALLRRRNAYIEEKQQFLRYFSAHLVLNEIPLFTLEDLKDQVRSFFQNRTDARPRIIVDELRIDDAGNPHFALQLIYCGVFVIVAIRGDLKLYDFPHRRFREVLAAEQINSDGYLSLLSKLESKGFSEFMEIFRKSPCYRNPEFHRAAFKKALEITDSGADPSYMLRVTREFIREKPADVDVSDMFWQFVRDKLRAPEPSFCLASSLVQAMSVPSDVQTLAQQAAVNAISVGAHLSLLLSLKILALGDRGQALAFGARLLAAQSMTPGVAASLTSLYVSCSERIPELLFTYLGSDSGIRDLMCFPLVQQWEALHAEDRTRVVSIICALPGEEMRRLLVRLLTQRDGLDDVAASCGSRLRTALVRDAAELFSEATEGAQVNSDLPFYFVLSGSFREVTAELQRAARTGRWIAMSRAESLRYAFVAQPRWQAVEDQVTGILAGARDRLLTSRNSYGEIRLIPGLLADFFGGQDFGDIEWAKTKGLSKGTKVLKVDEFLNSVKNAISGSEWSFKEIEAVANLAAHEKQRMGQWPEFFA